MRGLLSVFVIISAVSFAGMAAGADDAPAQDRPQARVVPQVGHAESVFSVAISPDGRFALSGSYDSTLKLWDIATGKELHSFKGHEGAVHGAVFSPDGRFVLSGGDDHTLKLWEVATGNELRSFKGHTHGIRSVAISPDGRFALSGSYDKTLKLWGVATGKELRSFAGHTNTVETVAFSPDGRLALSGSDDDTLKLWDIATGKELRSFSGHTSNVTSVAFSPDGRFVLSGSWDRTLKLWDVATGKELRSLTGHTKLISSVTFSPDSHLILSGSWDDTLKLWDAGTGKELRSFTGHADGISSVAFSSDGRFILSGSFDNTMKLWDVATGEELLGFKGYDRAIESVAFSSDGRFILSGKQDRTLKLWDAATGKALRSFAGHTSYVSSVAFSPDGRLALSGSYDRTLKLWDVATGIELRSFTGHTDIVESVAFSPDGRLALSGGVSGKLKLWDVGTGQELRSFAKQDGTIYSVTFSPDGQFALSGGSSPTADGTLKLWEVDTGKELQDFSALDGDVRAVAFSPDGRFALSGSYRLTLWEVATGKKLRGFAGHGIWVSSVAFSPDGHWILSGSLDGTVKLWDAATGKELRSFSGHTGSVDSAVFSPDGRFVLSGGVDGTMRIWSIEQGREIVLMVAGPSGDWLTITPEGFFSSSHRDTEMLAIVRGLNVTMIGQVHQSLFNPDLVREALAGDPDGEVERAAEVINLDKVLDAGPPPAVNVTSYASNGQSSNDLVTAAAHITDHGKGIGRIEWRVNGVTQGVMHVPARSGPNYNVKQTLSLDPGKNQIEVIAYERRNLIASLPARSAIAYDGPANSVKPKLHILAIGINAYVDKGSASKKFGYFGPLGLAVRDAKAFGAAMRQAGAGLYSDVIVTYALDAAATSASLDKLIEHIGANISPRDTFVLYAAAHGYSKNGRFYLIPQDYQGGADPEALASRAIDQDRLQDWIVNRIKAKKAVILLDTCESGAAINGYTTSRIDVPASEAGVGRLHEATGRPVLTAAAAGEFAREGYKGHGVFTYALIEALHRGDINNNGRIELTELAAHAAKRVPELVAELDESGGVVKGLAVVAMRGSGGHKQSARFGSTGEDFVLVGRLP